LPADVSRSEQIVAFNQFDKIKMEKKVIVDVAWVKGRIEKDTKTVRGLMEIEKFSVILRKLNRKF
jgi:hypothetical protein